MAAAIGWYGPLIDLSKASSHIGHFVQLLVLVHKSTPIQYKLFGPGEVIRTDIQVGDDTRPYFSVSVWQKHLQSMLIAGNIVLLQNIKIARFGDVVEGRTVQQSSVQCLVHPYQSIFAEGADNLVEICHIGTAAKEKLRNVIAWVQRAEPIICKFVLHGYQRNQQSVNWTVPEEAKNKDCFSLLEVLNLTDSCKASFFASIGEMFLPLTKRNLHEFVEERMFIRSRICKAGYRDLAEDLICTGCQSCGAPLDSEFGSRVEQDTVPLYCQRSSNRLHVVSLIYRPYLLYVWDESTCVPVLVKNKATELLLGNLKAETVYSSYRRQTRARSPNTTAHKERALKRGLEEIQEGLNFYSLWLIALKTLLQPGKNSPLKFKVQVDLTKDWHNGRCEMLSVSLPLL